ncbi:hypothetical protein PV327_011482 [Microctonus hyperodae]|uniref:Uncharacterized protein n=1 Tax=Microctonus hyperodae TaxID=165561 RepID=A0AA39FHM9_MICHY|nr:hypothetical protein PV327_011482 [Microctonus hyperodae]
MINIKATVFFVVFVGVICIYGIVRDSSVVKRSIHYEFMDFENELDDEHADSHARLARAVHLTILGTKPKIIPNCGHSNPCGWELYKTPGRQIYGFLHNVCQCNATASCVKHHDDISTYTYQYRCRDNITEWDEFAPTEDIVADGVVMYGNN